MQQRCWFMIDMTISICSTLINVLGVQHFKSVKLKLIEVKSYEK